MRDDPFHVQDPGERERLRLIRQSERLKPHTLRLLTAAGLKPGDKVLDVGSGTGDCAFIAAELVGPDGLVVGVERDPARCEMARNRARALEAQNVAFLTADVRAIETDRQFDAVIGRQVLVHSQGLDELVEYLAGLVRPGGVLAFHEPHWRRDWRPRIEPRRLMDDDLLRAFLLVPEICERAGGALDMGVRLPSLLARWGEPTALIVSPVAVGRAKVEAAIEFALDSACALLPAADRLGLAVQDAPELEAALGRLKARLAMADQGEPAMEEPLEVLAFVRKRADSQVQRAATQHES